MLLLELWLEIDACLFERVEGLYSFISLAKWAI
jgi:hypothetical protein